jgi:hypothetical protein
MSIYAMPAAGQIRHPRLQIHPRVPQHCWRCFRRHGAGFLFLHHRRRFGNGSPGLDCQMAQHGVIEAERVLQLVQGFLVAFDIHQHVMGLVDLLDRIGQLAAAPVFQTVDIAAFGSDQRAVTLYHRGHLLALIGVNDKHDFVMTHCISLWLKPPAKLNIVRCGGAR